MSTRIALKGTEKKLLTEKKIRRGRGSTEKIYIKLVRLNGIVKMVLKPACP